jgi:type II secretory pathway pseudopilin PulG
MRSTTHRVMFGDRPGRGAARGLARQDGFTVVEIIASIGVTVTVLAAGVATYVGTMHSWEGTSRLTEVQREASLAMDMIGRSVRDGSYIDISGDGDSLSVFVETPGGDVLSAAYYLNNGSLCDIDGTVLVPNVAGLTFGSSGGRTVNIDVTLADDMGTPDCATDDQSVLISSSVACRN